MFRAAGVWAEASGGRLQESDSLLWVTCPAVLRSFNQIFVKDGAVDIRALGDVVNAYRRENPLFRVRFRGEFEQDLSEAVAAVGLERRGGIPSMVLKGAAGKARGGDELDVRPVVEERALSDHVAVVAEAFGWEREVLGTVFTPRLLSEECWRGWVGYAEGEPVGASQLVVEEGVGGIYYVGTVEAYRGRGFGEMMTRRAVEEAARGCEIVSLQASPAGYPIYARMGFREVAEYVTYIDGGIPHE